jgi:hypothetical protein
MLWFAPRKPGSGWSGPNKQRIARLLAEGRMAPAGQEAVDRAQADGSWTKLDDVDGSSCPPTWRSPSTATPARGDRGRRSQVGQAGHPRVDRVGEAARDPSPRIDETARLAAVGERANQWPRT